MTSSYKTNGIWISKAAPEVPTPKKAQSIEQQVSLRYSGCGFEKQSEAFMSLTFFSTSSSSSIVVVSGGDSSTNTTRSSRSSNYPCA